MAFTTPSRAALGIVLAFASVALSPSRAQQTGDAPAVGLPSPSAISGPLVRLPDGQIAVAPAPSSEAPAAIPKSAPEGRPSAGSGFTPSARTQRAQSDQTATDATSNAHGGTITRQIANAPGWQQSHRYSTGTNLTADRVLAGPGWTAGSPGRFTNGLPVDLWIAQQTGTSAGSGNGPQSCTTPGTTTVVDGGITWKCLVQIDYNSITGFLFDDAAWQASTAYLANQYVVSDSPPKVYRINGSIGQGLTSPPYTCTSGSTAPTGTGENISDGTCAWRYVAALGYSSQAGIIPKQKYLSGYGVRPTIQTEDYHVGNIWYGGVSRQEYVPGSNGESDPIAIVAHQDYTHDDDWGEAGPFCKNGNGYADCGGTGTTWPTSYTKDFRITLQAQSTDSFMANPNVQNNALAYNSANGVAIHAITTPSNTIFGASGAHGGDAINSWDSGVNFYGLQIKSDHGVGVDGVPHGNGFMISNSIIDAVGWCYPGFPCSASGPNVAVWNDGGAFVANSLIIYRGTQPSGVGFSFKYAGLAINNTIVNLGSSTDSTCLFQEDPETFGNANFQNNLCIGFNYPSSTGNVYTLSADIDAVTTTVNLPSSYGGSQYALVDTERMQITGGIGTSTITVIRGIGGTTAAPHAAGAYMATSWTPTTLTNSKGNASSNVAQTTVAKYFTYGHNVGSRDLPGVGATCGGSNTCYGIAAANQFVNAKTDFRLKSNADAKGAGFSFNAKHGGWNTPFVNSSDIIGTPRPQAGKYDIGAWQALPSPPASLPSQNGPIR